MKLVTTALAMSLAGFSIAGLAPAQAEDITGAGSTFGAPIYSKWAEASAAATGIKLNYQGVGSGAGINQINNRTVDFGASDMPVAAAQLTEHKLMQFPTVIGGVVVIVNIPGVEPNTMKLTGELLADIYLGKITKWNDPKLVEANRDIKLPNLAIAPVYRADGSGTTFVYTDYLSMVSPDWKSSVGASTSVKWPAGNGAKGSDGVAATVRQVRGGIGYVESAYAAQNHLTTTLMRNKAGSFVAPDMDSFVAAAASGDWASAKNFAVDLNDEPGAKSWPIESATFVLLPTDPKDPAKNAAVIKFFSWAFDHGDDIARQLLYVPLPDAVHAAIKSAWTTQLKG
jgi:phosphate transport system substrate-binding protein